MAVEIRVPVLAESIHEATVGKWLKREGDSVAAGEAVLELETDKVNVEVTAPQAGQVEKISRKTGETVRPGDVLAVITERAGPPAAPRPTPAAVAAPAVPAQTLRAPAVAPAARSAGQARPAAHREVEATPVARNLVEALGMDITQITGTGPGGKVTREDVETYAARQPKPATPAPQAAVAAARAAVPPATAPVLTAPPAPTQPTAPRPPDAKRVEERVRLSRRRLTIAQRLSEVNREAVMTTTFNEVDMTGIADLRRKYRQEFKERHGVDLGFMSFFVKAVVSGLQAYPVVNSEMQGEEVVYKKYYDIGIAVAADEGLLVPVVRDADRKTFAEIERDVTALAVKAREKKLTLDELRGGTFTITNGGVFGSLMSTPVLNPPQVGILGMHRIIERPIAVGGQVAVRPMMYLAVTYDHRVVDGADAVRFLVRVKDLLEDPGRLLVHA